MFLHKDRLVSKRTSSEAQKTEYPPYKEPTDKGSRMNTLRLNVIRAEFTAGGRIAPVDGCLGRRRENSKEESKYLKIRRIE